MEEREPEDAAAAHALDVSSREGLLQALDEVEVSGWNCSRGDAVLAYARTRVVLPLVRELRLDGASASEAETVGWAAAWQSLSRPTIRAARSPWGVVRSAARAAILGELLAATYGTNVRRAWRLARLNRATRTCGRPARTCGRPVARLQAAGPPEPTRRPSG